MRIGPYGIYMAGMAVFVGLLLLTPYFALRGIGISDALYQGGAYICHQKISRSLCLFESRSGGLSVSDCLPQSEEFRADRRSELCVGEDGKTGATCALGGGAGACAEAGCGMESGGGMTSFSSEVGESETGKVGYKFPVSARDLLIYIGGLVGGLLVPFLWKIESKDIPNKWLLVIFLLPMLVDGGTQALGWRESTNLIRMGTGFLAGVIFPFYFIPMCNLVWGRIAPIFKKERRGAK